MFTNCICSNHMPKCTQSKMFLHDFPGKTSSQLSDVSAPFKGWYWVLSHVWKPKKTVALCLSLYFLDTLFFVIPKTNIWGFRWLQVSCDQWGSYSLLNSFRWLEGTFIKLAKCSLLSFKSPKDPESSLLNKNPAWRKNSGYWLHGYSNFMITWGNWWPAGERINQPFVLLSFK